MHTGNLSQLQSTFGPWCYHEDIMASLVWTCLCAILTCKFTSVIHQTGNMSSPRLSSYSAYLHIIPRLHPSFYPKQTDTLQQLNLRQRVVRAPLPRCQISGSWPLYRCALASPSQGTTTTA